MIKNFTCTPPYWTNSKLKAHVNCSNTQQLKDFHEMAIKDYLPPCRRMTQLTFLYSEYPSDYYHDKLQNLPIEDQSLFVTLFYPFSLDYKEITMLRELNIQSLIGNAGGYVGICVGYSILQIPNLVIAIHSKVLNILTLRKAVPTDYQVNA